MAVTHCLESSDCYGPRYRVLLIVPESSQRQRGKRSMGQTVNQGSLSMELAGSNAYLITDAICSSREVYD